MDHNFSDRELRLEPAGARKYRASLGCKGPDHLGQATWDGADLLIISFEDRKPHLRFRCTMGSSGRAAVCAGDVDSATGSTTIRRK